MFVAKPHTQGQVASLDGSDASDDIQNLAALDGAALLPAQDFGLYGNPDGAKGSLSAVPGVMQAPSTSAAPHNSGAGLLQKTAQTSAPKSNPFPAPKSAVRTSPSSIKV